MSAMARLYALAPVFARIAQLSGGQPGQGCVLERWLHDIDVSFTVAQHG
jgi:hypothetical protein